MATRWKSQQGEGTYSLQFETDNKQKYKLVEKRHKWRLTGKTLADVAEVAHGVWDTSGRYKFADGSLAIRCSECGCALHSEEYDKYHWNYCPNCGAKMDGGKI